MSQWEKDMCDYSSNMLWKNKKDVFSPLILHISVNKQLIGRASASEVSKFHALRFDGYLLG